MPDKDPEKEDSLRTWLRPFTNGEGKPMSSVDTKDWKLTRYATPGVDALNDQARSELRRYLFSTYYWAAEGQSPPKEWAWPKDMSTSYALHGPSAKPKDKDILRFDALEKQENGTYKLVSRSLDVSQKKSQPEPISSHDHIAKQIVVAPKHDVLERPDGKKVEVATRVYNAYFIVDKYAYDGSFNVHFFIGKPGDDAVPAGYMLQNNEIGFSGIFAARQSASCGRCAKNRERDLKYEDVVPLTPGLIDYLIGSSAESVDPALHPECTDGKPGGVRIDEQLE